MTLLGIAAWLVIGVCWTILGALLDIPPLQRRPYTHPDLEFSGLVYGALIVTLAWPLVGFAWVFYGTGFLLASLILLLRGKR
jgi:hypothetical protein